MRVKVPSTAQILTNKGFELVTNCIGDAVCIPYADTISAETLSFGFYRLPYTTMPVYTCDTTAPANIINLYPPFSTNPCSIDTNSLLHAIIVPTHTNYNRLFCESFLASPLEICNIPNIEVVVIKQLKEKGPFTLYNKGHELFTEAQNTILVYLNLFSSMLKKSIRKQHLVNTDIDPNIIIQTYLYNKWLNECVHTLTRYYPNKWKEHVLKYDMTSRVVVKYLDVSDYSKDELEYIQYLSHRLGVAMYIEDSIMYIPSWGIIKEGLSETNTGNRNLVTLLKKWANQYAKKVNSLYTNSDREFKLTSNYWAWLWKSTCFHYDESEYTGVVSMLLDASENLLPLGYKLTACKELFIYERCPFIVFSKQFNALTTEDWVELDTPEEVTVQIRYSNGIILPITITN